MSADAGLVEILPKPWDSDLQLITNGHPVPPRFTACRQGIGVLARVVWEIDGPEVWRTWSMGWTSHLVLVQVDDARLQVRGAWLAAADVRRDAQASPPFGRERARRLFSLPRASSRRVEPAWWQLAVDYVATPFG